MLQEATRTVMLCLVAVTRMNPVLLSPVEQLELM